MTPRFSIVIPTAGRATLDRTLVSVTSQLGPGDEVIVIRDDCEWGNRSRDRAVRQARGTHLLFIDDDDVYVPDALSVIRGRVADRPDVVHVFRMDDHGLILWQRPVLEAGQVGTPMVAVPRKRGLLGRWENDAGQLSDFRFLAETMRLRGDTPVFHEEIVALVRP